MKHHFPDNGSSWLPKKFVMATGIEECSFEALWWQLHLHEWQNKSDFPQIGTCCGLWLERLIFFRDRDKDYGISASSSNTVFQHLLFYWSTWVPCPSVLQDKRFHLSPVFVYLLFIHWNWHLWVRGVFWACAGRGVATADSRARQGKFSISWYGKVNVAQ